MTTNNQIKIKLLNGAKDAINTMPVKYESINHAIMAANPVGGSDYRKVKNVSVELRADIFQMKLEAKTNSEMILFIDGLIETYSK